MSDIVRNAIQCVHCGLVLESKHRHDYRVHECKSHPLGFNRKVWNETMTELVDSGEPAYPWMMVDGGHEYIRRGGNPVDYIELSEYK